VSRVFYRIILGPVPTLHDFKPHKELGKPLRIKSMEREWAQSVSVYDDVASAIVQAKKFPFLGSYLARVVIPDDARIEIARTFKDPLHFSTYLPALQVLKLVEGDTIPIAKGQEDG
jgi:hypothetical protein